MFTNAYLRFPDIKKNLLVFISDDDLWTVRFDFDQITKKSQSKNTPKPKSQKSPFKELHHHILDLHSNRITNSTGTLSKPKISPNADKIAYISNEAGNNDLYLISSYGGISQRLTFHGRVMDCDWHDQSTIIAHCASVHREYQLFMLNAQNGEVIKTLNYGLCNYYHHNQHGTVLGINLARLHNWKNYKGGDIGQIWSKPKTAKKFHRLFANSRDNIGCSQVQQDQIYFTSDKDNALAQIYRCDLNGKDLKTITNNQSYYVRSFAIDQDRLVYMSHGKLYLITKLGSKSQSTYGLNISVPGNFFYAQPRFINTPKYIQWFCLNYSGSIAAFIVRGGLYTTKPWLGSFKSMLDQSNLDQSLLDKHKPTLQKHSVKDKKNTIQSKKAKNKNKTNDKKSPSKTQSAIEQKSFVSSKYITNKTLDFENQLQGRFRMVEGFGNEDCFLSVIVNFSGEDRFVWHKFNNQQHCYNHFLLFDKNLGKINRYIGSNDQKYIVFSTHRNQLWIYHLQSQKLDLIFDKVIEDFDLSFDLQWVSFTSHHAHTDKIYVYNIADKTSKILIKPYSNDCCAVFDHSDSYMYFLSVREYYHITSSPFEIDSHTLKYSQSKPYIVALDKTTASILDLSFKFPENPELDKDTKDDDQDKEKNQDKEKDKKDNQSNDQKVNEKSSSQPDKKPEKKINIDFDQIDGRIDSLPVDPGKWITLIAAKDKLIMVKKSSSNSDNSCDKHSSKLQIHIFNKSTGSISLWGVVDDFTLSGNSKYILIQKDLCYSLLSVDEKPSSIDDKSKPKTLDLSAISHKVDPKLEWKQMLYEAWHLQIENFYNPDVKPNFNQLFTTYSSLLGSINTRSEFSDLVYELYGSLKTSHCYELSGDYPNLGNYLPSAKLGADIEYLKDQQCYEIKQIHHGESWIKKSRSPLMAPGVNIEVGDKIHAFDGIMCTDSLSADRYFDNRAGNKIELLVTKKSTPDKKQPVIITSLHHHHFVSYYNWVYNTRMLVKELSGDKIGYIHIPDMSVQGLSEFAKNYLCEIVHDHLILDLRYNAGGNVSDQILSYLVQKSIGFTKTKWSEYYEYPSDCAPNNLVCLINGKCGSDGDIFAHAFRTLKLGKLIGTRTWGGTIGIYPRVVLSDGTVTSQPEYISTFYNQDQSIENNGVVPDIEVDITPDDRLKNDDPQIKTAVDYLLKTTTHKKTSKKS